MCRHVWHSQLSQVSWGNRCRQEVGHQSRLMVQAAAAVCSPAMRLASPPAGMSLLGTRCPHGQSLSAQSGPAGTLAGGAAVASPAAHWMASMMPLLFPTASTRAAATPVMTMKILHCGAPTSSSHPSPLPNARIHCRPKLPSSPPPPLHPGNEPSQHQHLTLPPRSKFFAQM